MMRPTPTTRPVPVTVPRPSPDPDLALLLEAMIDAYMARQRAKGGAR